MAHPNDAQGFRDRLERVMARMGLNQAAFARSVGVDRSTLSQLLSTANDRLPRAETLAAISRGCRVSVDWLLGLTQREQVGAEMVETILTIEQQAHAPLNERFMRWYGEAAGTKIRTVPMTFPEFMKTGEVLAFEYAGFSSAVTVGESTLEERRGMVEAAIRGGGEFEACFPRQALETFARGEAQWHGLSRAHRREQIAVLRSLSADLYPALRLFLYDMRESYSAPFTIFGQSRAAIFLGPTYLVLNANEHIRLLTRRFEDLIRAAKVQPNEFGSFLDTLV